MKGTFEVRGEVIMTRKAFKELNLQQGEQGGKDIRESSKCRGGRGARARSQDYGLPAARLFRVLRAGGRPRAEKAAVRGAGKRFPMHFKASDDWKLCRSLEEVERYISSGTAKREKLRMKLTASSSR